MYNIRNKSLRSKNAFKLVKIAKPSLLFAKYGFKSSSGFSTSSEELSDVVSTSPCTIQQVISLENDITNYKEE